MKEEKWQKDYEQLKKEHEIFIEYFDRHRSCRCDIEICKHLEKAEKKIFNPKYYNLVNRRIIMGLQTMTANHPALFVYKAGKTKN